LRAARTPGGFKRPALSQSFPGRPAPAEKSMRRRPVSVPLNSSRPGTPPPARSASPPPGTPPTPAKESQALRGRHSRAPRRRPRKACRPSGRSPAPARRRRGGRPRRRRIRSHASRRLWRRGGRGRGAPLFERPRPGVGPDGVGRAAHEPRGRAAAFSRRRPPGSSSNGRLKAPPRVGFGHGVPPRQPAGGARGGARSWTAGHFSSRGGGGS
jgi:hypothetical protein